MVREKGELHLPGHNYTGAGTKTRMRIARGDIPINQIDELAMQHDINYLEAVGQSDRNVLVNQADDVMVNTALDIAFGRKDSTLRERVEGIVVAGILGTQRVVRSATGWDLQRLMGWA